MLLVVSRMQTIGAIVKFNKALSMATTLEEVQGMASWYYILWAQAYRHKDLLTYLADHKDKYQTLYKRSLL